MSSKQYGLLLPKKNIQNKVTKHSAFGDDSDSDKSDGASDWLKKSLPKREPTQSLVKKQTKLDMQRALEQDATVFQYDEIYDQMVEQQRQAGKSTKEKDRKPKYIQKLMISAEKRKVENERRIERQVQKERENEGDEFKDKETFVTSAYKKKLEEFAKLDAEQKRQDMLEEIGDVTKQQDISGFYRHLYQTTVSPKEESAQRSVEKETKQVEKETKETSKDAKKDRHYRKRKNSESSGDKDKDTEISSSSSSSSSESGSEEEKSSESETEDPKRIRLKEYSAKAEVPVAEIKVEEIPAVSQEVKPTEIVPEVSIWEKRTVGPVFEAAFKRYLERKNARLTSVH